MKIPLLAAVNIVDGRTILTVHIGFCTGILFCLLESVYRIHVLGVEGPWLEGSGELRKG